MTNQQPFVGPPAKGHHVGLCAYSEKISDPPCLAEATWHGYGADEQGEPTCGLESCDQHKPIMDCLARWVHQHDTPCGLPEALFYPDLNICAVPWVEAEMTIAAAHVRGATQ